MANAPKLQYNARLFPGSVPLDVEDFPKDADRSVKGALHLTVHGREVTKDEADHLMKTMGKRKVIVTSVPQATESKLVAAIDTDGEYVTTSATQPKDEPAAAPVTPEAVPVPAAKAKPAPSAG